VRVEPFDATSAFEGLTKTERMSVVVRANAYCSDRAYQYHSPNSITSDGKLTLGFPIIPELSQTPRQEMHPVLEGAIKRVCGENFGVSLGQGRSGNEALIVDRLISEHGVPFRERVAEFDYRWRGFIEYRYSPESTRIDSAQSMAHEGGAALTILKAFIDTHHQVTGERGASEVLRLSVER
jgi:hypothetical protein